METVNHVPGLMCKRCTWTVPPDAVTANFSANTISVLRNTATSGDINSSSFAAKVDFAAGSQPSGVAIADFDGDGKRDIAVAHNSAIVSVYRNTSTSGSISLVAKVDFTVGSGSGQLAVGDLDLDGKIDIVVRNGFDDDLSVLHNTATSGSITAGSFAPKVDFATGTNPITVGIGDIDGDGKPELVIPNRTSTTLAVHRNTTTGGVINSSSLATKVDFATGDTPPGIGIADFDGDGKLDLAINSQTPNTFSVYHNLSDRPTVSSISPLLGKVGDAVTITGTNFSTTPLNNVVWFGGAQATVTSASATSLTVSVPDGATHDRLSVTVNNRTAISDEYFFPTFDGEFPTIDASTFAPKVDFATGSLPRYLRLGDMDGDGKSDLLMANSGDNTLSVFRNTGSSGTISFAAKVDLTSNGGATGLNVGDFDGDGE